MVTPARAAVRPHQFRTLNEPRPLRVRVGEDGRPLALLLDRRWRPVEAIHDHWRVEDQWWRQPLSRYYFEVLTDGGMVHVLYQDRETGAWFLQRD
ncbi:MAG: hypothetical protein ACM3ZA_06375 [Bacillota bacterium]